MLDETLTANADTSAQLATQTDQLIATKEAVRCTAACIRLTTVTARAC
jgi:hypothetical protein